MGDSCALAGVPLVSLRGHTSHVQSHRRFAQTYIQPTPPGPFWTSSHWPSQHTANRSAYGFRDQPVYPYSLVLSAAAAVQEKVVAHIVSTQDSQHSAEQSVHQAEEAEPLVESWQANPNERIPLPRFVEGPQMTTVVVRNLSRRVSQEDVLTYWPRETYDYNMLYLIYDLKKKHASGRVFINFRTPHAAIEFRDAWHGQQHLLSHTDCHGKVKQLIVEAADRQGLEANIEHWLHKLRRDVDTALLPAIFMHGRRYDVWEYVYTMPGNVHQNTQASSSTTDGS